MNFEEAEKALDSYFLLKVSKVIEILVFYCECFGKRNRSRAVELALKQKLDMDDAIQYAVALSLNAESIISFDKHLMVSKYLEKNLSS